MGDPPSSAGAVHERMTELFSEGVAVNAVGASGTDAASVVALAVLDASLVPAELIARIV